MELRASHAIVELAICKCGWDIQISTASKRFCEAVCIQTPPSCFSKMISGETQAARIGTRYFTRACKLLKTFDPFFHGSRLHEFKPAEDGSTQPGPAAASEQPDGRVLESVPSGAIAEGILSTASTPRSGHSAASTPKSRGAIRSIADIRLGAHPTAADGTSDDGPGLTPRALKAFEEGKSLVEVVEEETSAVKEDPTLGADSLGPSDSAPVTEALAAAGAGIAAGFDAAVTAVGQAVSTAPVVAGVPEAGTAPFVPTLPDAVPDEKSVGDTVSGTPPLPPPVRIRSEPLDAVAGTSGTTIANQPTAAVESGPVPVENGDTTQKQPAPAASVQASPYGLPCLVEVFRFLCTLIVPEDGADKAQQHDSEVSLSISELWAECLIKEGPGKGVRTV